MDGGCYGKKVLLACNWNEQVNKVHSHGWLESLALFINEQHGGWYISTFRALKLNTSCFHNDWLTNSCTHNCWCFYKPQAMILYYVNKVCNMHITVHQQHDPMYNSAICKTLQIVQKAIQGLGLTLGWQGSFPVVIFMVTFLCGT